MENKKPAITNDYIFKQIFSKRGNESILKDFLIGVLEIPIEKIEVQFRKRIRRKQTWKIRYFSSIK